MGHQTLIGHDVTPCWRNHRLRTGFLADTQRQGIKLDQYLGAACFAGGLTAEGGDADGKAHRIASLIEVYQAG